MTTLKEFENKVKKEVKKLISKKDKVAVAFSGGKDSTTILYLLNQWGYQPIAIMINPGFKHFKKHVKNAQEFCKEQGIRLHLINADNIKELQEKSSLSNCMICGVIKRNLINKKARELGIKKLITGHNKDDDAESVIMNLIMNQPRLNLNLKEKRTLKNKSFIKRVKPLKRIAEQEIKKYSEKKGFRINYEICPRSSNAFRRYVRNLIKDYDLNPDNILKYLKKIMPLIENQYSDKTTLKNCQKCGEPASHKLCKACQLKKKNY